MIESPPNPLTVDEAAVPERPSPALSPEADTAVTAKPVLAVSAASEAVPAEPGIGVLIVNLGTPDAADPPAVRRYLKEFLTDPRVIEKDTLFWKFVLNGLILPL